MSCFAIHETERNQLEALSFVFARPYLCLVRLYEERHAANSSYIGILLESSTLFPMMNIQYVAIYVRTYKEPSLHNRFCPEDAMSQIFFSLFFALFLVWFWFCFRFCFRYLFILFYFFFICVFDFLFLEAIFKTRYWLSLLWWNKGGAKGTYI